MNEEEEEREELGFLYIIELVYSSTECSVNIRFFFFSNPFSDLWSYYKIFSKMFFSLFYFGLLMFLKNIINLYIYINFFQLLIFFLDFLFFI